MSRGTTRSIVALIGAATCVSQARPGRADQYINDPLTAPDFPGRGSKGGSYGADGWTTTNAPTDASQDAVWYEIADALPTGAFQATVTGLSVGGTLGGADHDLFCIYQAPTDQPEPVGYSPYFRNNDFKAFTRIFGIQEPGRAGAMKLELAFCPRGEPWWHDEPCTPDCEKSGIAYANGQQTDVGWDPGTPYTIRIEWTDGVMSFFRNGAKLGDVPFAGFYAPKPMRVRIGTPRNDGVYPGVAYMPAGLVFRDVLIEGTPGAQTPVCGAVDPPDGGTDGGSPDAGSGPMESAAIQDVTAASWEAGVYPEVNDLNVEGAPDGMPAAVVYLRFPAPAGPVQKATLVLRAHADGSAAGGSGVICQVEDHTWDENTMTWSTRPAVGTCVGAPKGVEPDSELQWDVTDIVGSGESIDLAVVSTDGDGAHYVSKEAGGPTNGPRLLVWTGTTSGSTGTGGASSGTSGSAANGATSGVDEDPAGSEGCGCRVPRGRAPLGLTLLSALALAAALVRRARREGPRRSRGSGLRPGLRSRGSGLRPGPRRR